ncbi:MAG: hypothetical protein KTR14_10825 [Vampirovibrio sp.]|nr:hypothetical protein [Vampirovibrio sp.]
MSYLEEQISLEGIDQLNPPRMELVQAGTASVQAMKSRINDVAGFLVRRQQQHDRALKNTQRIFDGLLDDLHPVCNFFKEAMQGSGLPEQRIYADMDPDRSIGILNLCWHTLSFMARGNHLPMAVDRPNREPLFTGRIVAISSDFADGSQQLHSGDFHDVLQHEVASLYVPAASDEPVIMRIPHLGGEDLQFEPREAARQFLLKTVEMVCSGGAFHEKSLF